MEALASTFSEYASFLFLLKNKRRKSQEFFSIFGGDCRGPCVPSGVRGVYVGIIATFFTEDLHFCVRKLPYKSATCMPQVDKATFFPIVFWTFALYIAGFLLLNTSSLFTFLSSLKLSGKRTSAQYSSAVVTKRLVASLLFFPLIAL